MVSIVSEQKKICKKFKAKPLVPKLDEMVGIAVETLGGREPVNGMRGKPEGRGCGWFIWAGNKFSKRKDFFKPIHYAHASDYCRIVVKYLALPPGFRFQIDHKGYEDIWFDEKLLKI